MVGEFLTEFAPFSNARKRVQEMVKFQENPANLYFQKTANQKNNCFDFPTFKVFYGCFLFLRKFQEICIFKKHPKNGLKAGKSKK